MKRFWKEKKKNPPIEWFCHFGCFVVDKKMNKRKKFFLYLCSVYFQSYGLFLVSLCGQSVWSVWQEKTIHTSGNLVWITQTITKMTMLWLWYENWNFYFLFSLVFIFWLRIRLSLVIFVFFVCLFSWIKFRYLFWCSEEKNVTQFYSNSNIRSLLDQFFGICNSVCFFLLFIFSMNFPLNKMIQELKKKKKKRQAKQKKIDLVITRKQAKYFTILAFFCNDNL